MCRAHSASAVGTGHVALCPEARQPPRGACCVPGAACHSRVEPGLSDAMSTVGSQRPQAVSVAGVGAGRPRLSRLLAASRVPLCARGSRCCPSAICPLGARAAGQQDRAESGRGTWPKGPGRGFPVARRHRANGHCSARPAGGPGPDVRIPPADGASRRTQPRSPGKHVPRLVPARIREIPPRIREVIPDAEPLKPRAPGVASRLTDGGRPHLRCPRAGHAGRPTRVTAAVPVRPPDAGAPRARPTPRPTPSGWKGQRVTCGRCSPARDTRPPSRNPTRCS